MKYLWILIIICSCLCLSSCRKDNVPSFEEYYAAHTSDNYFDGFSKEFAEDMKIRHREQLEGDWNAKYGDLMYHADGRLRDQNYNDDYTAIEAQMILLLVIWGVFFVWAGIGTKSVIGFFIVQIIGLILALIVWSF